MFSKDKSIQRIDADQREQYEYARRRINQKKRLMQHFIFFLAGSILFIILSALLNIGNQTLMQDWYIWAILIWAFILMVHAFNVAVLHKFMDKEWENRQLEKLKAKQADKIAEIQNKVNQEIQLPGGNLHAQDFKKDTINNPLPPDVQ